MPSERKLDVAAIKNLVIAGWTGRNVAALEAHIKELEALGVKRPKSVPIFYRVAASLLTTAGCHRGDGRQVERRGRVRAVRARRRHVGRRRFRSHRPQGRDHRRHAVEADVRQAGRRRSCGATTRSSRTGTSWCCARSCRDGGKRRLYQEGPVTNMRSPEELIRLYTGGDRLAPGTAMFCGTFAVHGGISSLRHVRDGAGRPGARPQAHARLSHRVAAG